VPLPGSLVSDLTGAEDSGIHHNIDQETLRHLISQLSPRDKQILLMRYFRGMTQSQIGVELGVSHMQVSRLLAAILGRLRQRGADSPAPARPWPEDIARGV
jgi:RNA polymerase sigma-B factor